MHNEGQTPRHSILCGPIAPQKGVSRGGYETANRRTISLLVKMGWSVTELAYPDTLGKAPLQKYATYLAGFIRIWRELGSHRGCPTHFTPLFKHFIFPEYILLRRARRRGLYIVLDLRAGNKASDRKRKGRLYRWLFDQSIRIADRVSVEGQDYIPLVKNIDPHKTPLYLPNFIEDASIATTLAKRDARICRLIYVGTVSPEKGVPDLIQTADRLRDGGLDVCVDIIGRPSESFADDFHKACAERPHITFHGAKPFDFVRNRLDQSHFFVFLTKWPGEGHSNALTESMARGCIPIVTDHGFNRSTVAGNGVVIKDRADHQVVADEIRAIWQNDDLRRRGSDAITHVRAEFSEAKIQSTLRQLYCDPLLPGSLQNDAEGSKE